MTVDIDPAWLISVYLVTLRIGVLFVLTPIFFNLSGLVTVRVLFSIALSVMLVAGLGVQTALPTLAIGPLIVASLAEIVVGGAMAFGVFAAFGAFSVAGKILDIQSGFGIGSVFDPVTRAGSPIYSTLLNLVAVAVFFSMNAHHAFLRGIAFSLQNVPVGQGLLSMSGEAVIVQFGLMFSMGVALIAPVIFCLFMVEAALAVMSRVLPQMNIFIVGMPVKIFASFAMLAVTAGMLGPQMARIYASIFTYWERVLR